MHPSFACMLARQQDNYNFKKYFLFFSLNWLVLIGDLPLSLVRGNPDRHHPGNYTEKITWLKLAHPFITL